MGQLEGATSADLATITVGRTYFTQMPGQPCGDYFTVTSCEGYEEDAQHPVPGTYGRVYIGCTFYDVDYREPGKVTACEDRYIVLYPGDVLVELPTPAH